MTVFLRDTMTDPNGTLLTDHTPEVGGAWTKQSGISDIDIQTNRAKGTSNFSNIYTNGAEPRGNEYDIEMDLSAVDINVNHQIYARFTDEDNWYRSRWTFTALLLEKSVVAVITILDSVTLSAVGVDTERLQIRDATKRFFVDGVEQLATADNDVVDVGIVGVGADLETRLDNLVATDLAAVDGPVAAAFGPAVVIVPGRVMAY